MTALLTLAKSLGIDPGPLNQTELQEQTCSKALAEIQHWRDQLDKTCEEGCTPADAEKLKGFNAQLAYENFDLKNERDSQAKLLRDIKEWDVGQYIVLPVELRQRIQAAIEPRQILAGVNPQITTDHFPDAGKMIDRTNGEGCGCRIDDDEKFGTLIYKCKQHDTSTTANPQQAVEP